MSSYVTKDILNRVISRLNSKKNGYCMIMHKRGWLDYLLDGDPVFRPVELHSILRAVIDCDAGKPRGTRLFSLRKTLFFKMMPNGTPYRTEEALERFIIVSNGDNFFNQISIGGGKESIDIGFAESDSKFIFVELKPWESQNSPLYALVESLKNLISYRIILERNLADIPRFQEIELMVLAPFQYYQKYGLDVDHNIGIMQKTLGDVSTEFHARISFMALDFEKTAFQGTCRAICKRQGLNGEGGMDISKELPVPALSRRNWKSIVDCT